MELMIEDLMQQLVEGGGSDLHIASGQPPYGRFSGELRPMLEDPLTEEACNRLIFSMLNNGQRKTLEQTWELDCAYGLKGVARFRVNVYRQKGSYAACLRALGSMLPPPEPPTGGDAAGFGTLGVFGVVLDSAFDGGGGLGAAFDGPARFVAAFPAATGRRRIAVGPGFRRVTPRSTTAGGGIFTEAAFCLKANDSRFRPPRGATPGAPAGKRRSSAASFSTY